MLGALTVRMSGDCARVDGLNLGRAGALNRVLEKAVEDAEATVGRMDDGYTGLTGLAALFEQQCVVANDLAGQNRDRRVKTTSLDLGLNPARPVEVRMAVAEPIVCVEKPRNGLDFGKRCVVNLNLIGGRLALAGLARELGEGDVFLRHNTHGINSCAEPLTVAAQVDEPQVVRHRFNLSELGRRSVEPATKRGDRFAPILNRAANRSFGQLHLNYQLAGRVIRVGALDDPCREPVNHLPEPLGIGCFEPTSKREALNDDIHEDKLTGLTADRYPHAVGHSSSLRQSATIWCWLWRCASAKHLRHGV